jgi:outer membrane protein OmpA-like peptidoglycan-associated protein
MKAIARMLLAAALIASAAGSAFCQDGWKGTGGLLHVERASTVGRGNLIFSLGTSYYRSGETLTRDRVMPRDTFSIINYTSINQANVDYDFFLSRAALTFGLSDYIEFSAALNVRNWIMQVGDEVKVRDTLETRTRGGIGDTDLLLKICLPIPTKYMNVGFLGEASFPTGRKEAGFTTNKTDFGLKGLMTFNFVDLKNFVPTRLHLNLGYRFNRLEDTGFGIFNPNNPDSSGFYPPAYPRAPKGKGANFNDVFQFGAGLEFLAKQSSLFIEFMWDDYLNADFLLADTATYYLAGNKNIYTITPGVKLVSSTGVALTLAADFSLNSESQKSFVRSPDWAVYFMLSMGGNVLPQDKDQDGIEDKVDACPNDPEDFDGFEDTDGCPDLDNDKDGIADKIDKCPDLVEDFDGFQDEDGCPDLDNDGDGIPDVKDKCPNEPEDFDGVQDQDGCPDIVQDSDNDGIPDDKDKCPLKAEDFDGFQDEDGCPDLDNDLDGIPDSLDKCPNEPETYNGYQDEDGCPDERPIEEKFILRGVNFESGSAALTPDSYGTLDQVVKSLKAYPEVRIEIAGFTDDVGKDDYNLGLSQRRAEAVKQYLVNSGLSADRIVARGYGETNPIAANSAPAGRAENRRIEFRRLN